MPKKGITQPTVWWRAENVASRGQTGPKGREGGPLAKQIGVAVSKDGGRIRVSF